MTVTGKMILQDLANPGTIGGGTMVMIGAVADTLIWDASPDNSWFAGSTGTDSLNVKMTYSDPNTVLTFASSEHDSEASTNNWDPSGTFRIDISSADGADLVVEEWYDIKIEIDYAAGTAQAFYKRTTEPTIWTVVYGDVISSAVGTLPADDKLPIPTLNDAAGIYNPMINVGICTRYYDMAVDDVGVVLGVPPVGDIDVTVTLEDHTANLSPLLHMLIEVLDGVGASVASVDMTPNDTVVNHVFQSMPVDTYTVKVSAPKWLTKAATGVVVTAGGSTPVVLSLPNGDVDGDNTVDNADINVGVTNLDEAGS